jgi:hypothetical protein
MAIADDLDDPFPDDPNDLSVPTRSGPLQWGNPERKLFNRIIHMHHLDQSHAHAFDPSRADDPAYLGIHHARWPMFHCHPKKNFYQNVHRAMNEWQANQSLRGTWRPESKLLLDLQAGCCLGFVIPRIVVSSSVTLFKLLTSSGFFIPAPKTQRTRPTTEQTRKQKKPKRRKLNQKHLKSTPLTKLWTTQWQEIKTTSLRQVVPPTSLNSRTTATTCQSGITGNGRKRSLQGPATSQ